MNKSNGQQWASWTSHPLTLTLPEGEGAFLLPLLPEPVLSLSKEEGGGEVMRYSANL
jgi:hypothetical protein